MRIRLDKYYTPSPIAQYCVEKTKEVIGSDKITEFFEPSAGSGVFLPFICDREHNAVDIEPETPSVIRKDYLAEPFQYRKGKCVIGNPPFGARMNTAKQFYKKAVKESDYISFILPISQLRNRHSLYEFDLIHSEDLGKISFSGDRKLHCCLNIWKRPDNGLLLKRPKNDLECAYFVRNDQKKFKDFHDYDVRVAYWGNGCAGKVLKEGEYRSGEYKIKIAPEFKERCIKVLEEIDWKQELDSISMRMLQKHHIIQAFKKHIPGIH